MKLVFNNLFSSILVLLLMVFSTSSMAADESFSPSDDYSSKKMWNNVGNQTQATRQLAGKSSAPSLIVRSLELDEVGFKSLLNDSIGASDNSVAARKVSPQDNVSKTITLPLPNGSEVNLKITPTSVISAALSQQFPEIKTWKVSGVTEEISGSIDFTPQGFHGMLILPDGDRIFIEPDIENVTSNQGGLSTQGRYISFSKKQNQDNFNSEFSCGVDDDDKLNFDVVAKGSLIAERIFTIDVPELITYRLAVATTGEYTQFHGGSIVSALSAIVTTMNRVNQIYARDLGIVFQLVDEQTEIIYLNPDTDPYTNSDVFQLIQENNLNLSSSGVLSKDRYDVGHVFGAGNVGGLAIVGGVCNDDQKAFGATGISNPFGDAFALDYVAHELGHQLGGTHTFNSACGGGSERTAETAVEPGSGTTIMAYPGICQENDIQNYVDSQFHIVSIDQIRAVTRTGSGRSCAVPDPAPTINENPTVNAGADMVVPARTPLMFVAEGADTDNDELTYSWEQSDTGTVSDLNEDTGDNALFRSRPLSSSSVRFIPKLIDLFEGEPADGELLPVTNRDINMVATVRDGNGGLQADLVKLEVSDSGDSFRIISNTNNQTFARQDTANISWNVADTNLPPISCASVDIGVVTSDGNGINIVTTANDGQQQITIPDSAPAMDDARFIVSCSDNNFFNVSSGIIFFNVSSGIITILDQIGGGSIGAASPIAANIFSATDGISDTDDSSGGGGSFGMFMLLWGSLLICIREKRLIIQ